MLRPNSTIAVIAPAGIPNVSNLLQGMDVLREWGYRPIEGKHARNRHFFFAGTAEERARDLLWALTDPEIDAVWLARGGYGTIHCLSALDAVSLPDRAVIGYSDATALFGALSLKGNTRLVHGPLIETLATKVDDTTRERIRAVLSDRPLARLEGTYLCGPEAPVRGSLVGGNLCVLASLVGTPWALRPRDAIVVLEDIGEPAYRIDRFLQQLRYGGFFEGVRGVVLGEFTDCKVPSEASYTMDDVLREALSPIGVPVLSGLPIGHGTTNLAWRHGQSARIQDGALWFDAKALV